MDSAAPTSASPQPPWRWPSWSWRLAAGAFVCLLLTLLCDKTQWNEFPNLIDVRLNGIAALLGVSGVLCGLVSLVMRALGRRLGWRAAVSLLLAMLVNAGLTFVGLLQALFAAHTFA
jgi:hypothetical protein